MSSYFVNGPTCAGLRLRQGRNTEKTSRELKLCLKKVFIYFFYLDFAKIYGPLEFLQNYTYAVVVHGVRDITSWPTAVGAASNGLLGLTAACHDVRSLTPWAMAVGAYRQAAACPPGNTAGHGGMYGCAAAVGFFLTFQFLKH
jgi:hypothetical protein